MTRRVHLERVHEVCADLEVALDEARAVLCAAEREVDQRSSTATRARHKAALAEALARELEHADPARAEAVRRVAERAARRRDRAEANALAAADVFVDEFFAPCAGLMAARERIRAALAELDEACRVAEKELDRYNNTAWKRVMRRDDMQKGE